MRFVRRLHCVDETALYSIVEIYALIGWDPSGTMPIKLLWDRLRRNDRVRKSWECNGANYRLLFCFADAQKAISEMNRLCASGSCLGQIPDRLVIQQITYVLSKRIGYLLKASVRDTTVRSHLREAGIEPIFVEVGTELCAYYPEIAARTAEDSYQSRRRRSCRR